MEGPAGRQQLPEAGRGRAAPAPGRAPGLRGGGGGGQGRPGGTLFCFVLFYSIV